MNKTSSKETSTLSCLQKSLCAPSHRSFQCFLTETSYIPVFFPFFGVSAITFPLVAPHQSNVLIHLAVLTSERNDLIGVPPQFRQVSLEKSSQPSGGFRVTQAAE